MSLRVKTPLCEITSTGKDPIRINKLKISPMNLKEPSPLLRLKLIT